MVKECQEAGIDLEGPIHSFKNESDQERENIEYIITLGGDGTVLWASKSFSGSYIPPIIGFGCGSLGYLCHYSFDEHPKVCEETFHCQGEMCKLHVENRLRLKIKMSNPIRDVFRGNQLKDSVKMTVDNFHVINEIVVDRGPSPYAV